MSKPTLQLGGGNWAAKQGNLLAFAEGDTSGKYIARELGFSRAADIAATRVNKDGLVEKYRENLVHYSNNFATVSGGGGWGHSGINTISTGQDGYDGTTNATFVRASTSSGKHQVTLGVAQSLPGTDFSLSGVFTLSVYAKPNGYDHLILRSDRTNVNASFNIATGVVGTKGSECIESSMTAIGNGFYRCKATFAPGAATTFLAIGMMEADDTTDFTGDTSKGYILQDAQLEVGFVATELIPTSGASGKAGVLDNLPRIDYTSGSARLLLEPQRENLVTDSEGNISQMGGAATRTYKPDEVSPTGYKGGVVELSNLLGADGDRWQVAVDISDSLPSTAKTWTGSMYIKGTSGEKIDYQIKRNNAGGFEGSDIETVTFDGTWQRLTATFTNDTDNDQAGFFLTKRDSTTADKVLIWGRQIEEGPNATSYIPTHGATDTRVADDVTAFDMTKLDLGTTCSVYWEGEIYGPDVTYVRPITTFKSHSSPSNSDRFLLHTHGHSGTTCTLTSRITLGGTNKDVSKSGLTIGDKVKCLTVIDGTSHKFYVNGDLAGSVTITSDTYFNSLDLSNIAADINYTVDDIRFYPTAIGQLEAEDLTDL